jgi:hypothetical protein
VGSDPTTCPALYGSSQRASAARPAANARRDRPAVDFGSFRNSAISARIIRWCSIAIISAVK